MIKVYSTIFMGDLNANDPKIFNLITKITADSCAGSIVEFRPLSEDEFTLVREFAIANKGKLIYSSYDESMRDSVEMHLLDGRKEFNERRRSLKDK
jgi:hypothetical protein